MAGAVTGMGGVAVASRAFRGMRLPGACDANLGPLRKIEKGYTAGQMVETVVAGLMVGADCAEALDRLQGDEAVARILGYKPASVRSVRDWLEKCHDEGLVRRARETAGELALKASIPEPSTGLHALQAVLGVSAREASARLPDGSPRVATVDADATVVESGKRAATWTYTGEKGYQPMVAAWAECGVVLATEFRDGNVPAAMAPLACIRQAFAELPSCVRTYGCRGDSACDNQELLGWLDDEQRPGGPSGTIYYAISARMVPDLAEASRAVPDSGWTTFGKDEDGTLRQWAELDYVPGLRGERRSARPRRYIGLRLLKAQGELFDDGHDRKHFAVVTNRTERGDKVDRVAPREGGHDRAHPRRDQERSCRRAPSQPEVRCQRRLVRPQRGGLQRDGRPASGRRRSREPGDADQEPALRSADGQRAPHTLQPQDHPALRRYPRMGRARDPPAGGVPLPGTADRIARRPMNAGASHRAARRATARGRCAVVQFSGAFRIIIRAVEALPGGCRRCPAGCVPR